MRRFLDVETQSIISFEDLQKEFAELKALNEVEVDNFKEYLKNCLECTLKEIK